MRGGFLAGVAVGGAGLSWLLRTTNYHTAALTLSGFLLALTVVTFFIKEQPADALWPWSPTLAGRVRHQQTHSIGWLFRELFRGLLTKNSLRFFIPVLLVYSCQDAFIRAYNFHLIRHLGWRDVELSAVSGTYGVGIVVVVVLLGGWLADRIGARRMLVGVILFHAVYLLTLNGLTAYWSDRNVATAGAILWSMMDPSLSIAAIPLFMSLCRRDVEGSQFTTYMALINLSGVLGAFISGHTQEYMSAPVIGFAGGLIVLAMAGVAAWAVRSETVVPA
jgi:MFS transporter, PAT family, beta-lactamase induction signal transducer AmpG